MKAQQLSAAHLGKKEQGRSPGLLVTKSDLSLGATSASVKWGNNFFCSNLVATLQPEGGKDSNASQGQCTWKVWLRPAQRVSGR